MAKDPAVLFYTQDFIAGTLTMSNEHRGMYITLLCLQHQKGVLSEKDMLSICGTYVKDVFEKFTKDKQGNYFNKRMKEEAEKRKAYSESRRKNREKSKKKEDVKNISVSYVQHMENENEDVNVNSKKEVAIKKVGEQHLEILSKEHNLDLNYLRTQLAVADEYYQEKNTEITYAKFDAWLTRDPQSRKNPQNPNKVEPPYYKRFA